MKIFLINVIVISFYMVSVSPTLYSVSPNFKVAYERAFD